jgi:hypothetical protein
MPTVSSPKRNVSIDEMLAFDIYEMYEIPSARSLSIGLQVFSECDELRPFRFTIYAVRGRHLVSVIPSVVGILESSTSPPVLAEAADLLGSLALHAGTRLQSHAARGITIFAESISLVATSPDDDLVILNTLETLIELTGKDGLALAATKRLLLTEEGRGALRNLVRDSPPVRELLSYLGTLGSTL